MNGQVTHETIVRTLGLPACATLEYLFEDMHFVPGEMIPHRFLEGDDALQEALVRLGNRTGLIRKTGMGWRIGMPVYEAVRALTEEKETELCRAEFIRQTIAGALEKYGLVSMATLNDIFSIENIPQDVWQAAYADLFEPAYYEAYDAENDTRYVAHPALEDAGDLLAAQDEAGASPMISDLASLRLSAGWLPGNPDIHFAALEWLSRQGITPEDAAVLLQNAICAMQGSGEAENMIAEIAAALEMDCMPEDAADIFEKLAQRVPRWILGSASMLEFQQMQNS